MERNGRWRPPDVESYAYLLGMYLGDGCSCATCERLGIRWTQSNARNMSVSQRRSVALLDEIVGPKV
jgi:hypothetical protein